MAMAKDSIRKSWHVWYEKGKPVMYMELPQQGSFPVSIRINPIFPLPDKDGKFYPEDTVFHPQCFHSTTGAVYLFSQNTPYVAENQGSECSAHNTKWVVFPKQYTVIKTGVQPINESPTQEILHTIFCLACGYAKNTCRCFATFKVEK